MPSATGILNRFLNHGPLVAITGRSYRLKGRGENSDKFKTYQRVNRAGGPNTKKNETQRPKWQCVNS